MISSEVVFKAPGRVCLFGDHQDYLELPVIACAIDRFIEIRASVNESNLFNLSMLDLKSTRTFSINESFTNLEEADHIASVFRVVRRYGCIPNKGYDITIQGNIPINAGLSSSSALAVAWTRFLLNTFGCNQQITDELVARIAYEAEVLEHNSPGGKMDQYSIAIGDIIFLKTDDSNHFKKIQKQMCGLVIGESGIPKNTVGLLGDLKGRALKAIDLIKQKHPNFELEKVASNEIEEYSLDLPLELQPYFYAAIRNHVITKNAYAYLMKDVLSYKVLGDLMNQHHTVLKNVLKITTPKIDKMIDAALKANAYGAKIVGSGGGGSICAIVSEKDQENVIKSMLNAGATKAYTVNVVSNQRVLL